MDAKVQNWRREGKHLPAFMRDFHHQKEIFKAIQDMMGEQDKSDLIKWPNWDVAHVYVLDCFLWFMARHGYTLQRSRKKLNFDSLEKHVAFFTDRRNQMFAEALGMVMKTPPATAAAETDPPKAAAEGDDFGAALLQRKGRLAGVDEILGD